MTIYGACPSSSTTRILPLTSARIIGCRIASSFCFAAGSANTSWRMRSRLSAPSARRYSAPNCTPIACAPGWPGAVSWCAISSVSTTAAPSSLKIADTLLLPLPTPPVRAMTNGIALPGLQVVLDQRVAPEHGDQSAQHQIGTERDRHVASVTSEHNQRDTDNRADE